MMKMMAIVMVIVHGCDDGENEPWMLMKITLLVLCFALFAL